MSSLNQALIAGTLDRHDRGTTHTDNRSRRDIHYRSQQGTNQKYYKKKLPLEGYHGFRNEVELLAGSPHSVNWDHALLVQSTNFHNGSTAAHSEN